MTKGSRSWTRRHGFERRGQNRARHARLKACMASGKIGPVAQAASPRHDRRRSRRSDAAFRFGAQGYPALQMMRDRKSGYWYPAVVGVGGGIGVIIAAYICFLLGFTLPTAGFSLMIVVAALSLLGSYVGSVAFCVVAVACLSYFFAPPILSFRVDNVADVVVVAAFLTTSIIVTGLSARVRKMAAEELRETRAELARFARVAMLGELTASIAHEINQPLAGIVSSGNACQRWLAAEPPNIERAAQSLERIVRDGNRASEVIERIRGLAKNAPPQRTWLNINEALQEVLILVRGEMEKNHVALRTQLAEDALPVWADRIQLQQVFLNLIVNAIEAMSEQPDGPRELLVSTAKDGAGGMLAAVQDSGAGLDADTLPRIFDAFYTTKREGMGMGLAVCRSIIEAHGGRLWATPSPPRGAVFRFTLPAGREAAP